MLAHRVGAARCLVGQRAALLATTARRAVRRALGMPALRAQVQTELEEGQRIGGIAACDDGRGRRCLVAQVSGTVRAEICPARAVSVDVAVVLQQALCLRLG